MPSAHIFFVKPRIPKNLQALEELSFNLYRHWDYAIDNLFRKLDPDLWEFSGENPVFFLRRIQEDKLEKAAADPEFTTKLEEVYQRYKLYMNSAPAAEIPADRPAIAYFSAEFGLAESLPVYAGGLGILAGDHLKSASDLGLPLVGVGLFYREGYNHQRIDNHGWQREYYPSHDISDIPLTLISQADGSPLTIGLDFPERHIRVQIWQAQVGRINLYLLDTNHPDNNTQDRNITDRLYSGDLEKRIQQEIVLGIGGIRALAAMGIKPSVCHMNEGHSAFLGLERIRQIMAEFGMDFRSALELAAGGSIFTTHTPVPAGIDIFPPSLIDKYFTDFYQSLGLSRQEFFWLGQMNPYTPHEPFNMAVLALHLAVRANGVSILHGLVARRMWQSLWPELPLHEVPIEAITNGVHTTTWIGESMIGLYDRHLGTCWRENPGRTECWDKLDLVQNETLWNAHENQKAELVQFARKKAALQLKTWDACQDEIQSAQRILNPGFLTIGFARRFAEYKRPTLIFHDMDRLARILTNPDRPVQIIFSGKSHPNDDIGKGLIQKVISYARREDLRNHIVFLEDYDMQVARYMVHGVDLWLGNPRRPLEASSTSGMKAALNGALQLSTLDGWWDEAWLPELGWAIGGREDSADTAHLDVSDAESLYDRLENEIAPLYYDQDPDGLPTAWLNRMRRSIKAYGPRFNTHRMVTEYAQQMYTPSYRNFQNLQSNDGVKATDLATWKTRVKAGWPDLRIDSVNDNRESHELVAGDWLSVRAKVFLGSLIPDDVLVEAYYGTVLSPDEIGEVEQTPLKMLEDYGSGWFLFGGDIPCRLSGRQGYMIRILPRHKDLVSPFISGLILWG